jgi:hypothetical protein
MANRCTLLGKKRGLVLGPKRKSSCAGRKRGRRLDPASRARLDKRHGPRVDSSDSTGAFHPPRLTTLAAGGRERVHGAPVIGACIS